MKKKLETLVTGLQFPEGPRWHDEKLYFSDMNDCKVLSVDMEGQLKTIIDMPGPCSGLGWLPDGRLLIVSMLDRCLMSWDGKELALVCNMYDMATYHCNDMVVDHKGRAYIGNFGFDLSTGAEQKEAEIIMVDSQGNAKVAADGLKFPNGSVITPDNKTLIVAETYGECLSAFDINDDGMLSNKKIWANLPGTSPDGICLDTEGGIWVASPFSSELLRVLEGGKITDQISLQNSTPYACMLGGKNKTTLFVATSGQTYKSGRIEYTIVDLPGAGLP